ncbi:hypothetical protein QM201_25400 [Enterobacter asburiae]|nr:hypothetical protein [Enterobacter asburiae]
MDNEEYRKTLRKLRAWFLSFLTPALVSTVIAALFIWAHLARIGQSGLFFESLSFSSLFSYLMVFACVSLLLFCLVFFLPSMLTGLFISYNQVDNSLAEEQTENNIRIILLTSLFSVLIFFGYIFLSLYTGKAVTQNNYVQMGIIWLISILLSLWFNLGMTRTKIAGESNRKKLGIVFFRHILQPALFALTACIYVFPLELFLRNLEFPEGTGHLRQAVTVIGLSIFLIIFSLIPGTVYLRLRTRTSLLRQVGVVSGVMGAIMFLICTLVHMVPALILTMFLNTSGIMDLRPHVYGVPTASYPEEYFRDSAWQGEKSLDSKYYLLKAVKIYALGDIQLICPISIITSYKNSLKYQMLDTDYDDNVRGKLQDAVSLCRKVKSQELLTLEKLPQVDNGDLEDERP